MPSVYDLKAAFQRLLRPLVGRLARAGVTPNQVTLAALALSIATGALVAILSPRRWPLLLVPAALLFRMALNAIDGMLAREHSMRSRLGAILNELGDVVADAALYLPLCLVPGIGAAPVVAAVFVAALVEMTGVVAVQVGAERRYDGPMGKSDRALVFGALALLLGVGVEPGSWANLLVWAVAALGAVTIRNRARRALAEGP